MRIRNNGHLPEKIMPTVIKYPGINIIFGFEGNEETNNLIRGEKSGFRTKADGLARLKKVSGTVLGSEAVVQNENVT